MSNKLIETFPDGTKIDEWFYDTPTVDIESLGKKYVVTDYSILSDGNVYTKKLQQLIDDISSNGGGVVVIPKGEFLTGAIWFKQGVNLYLEDGAILKASDNVADYPVCDTRIEGESCKYFPALINADGLNGFTICGEGVIDGNGENSWKAFWKRREWNPACTNKDEQRARLVFISKSSNVTISNVRLQNSQFWTCHLYKCSKVKVLNCSIFAPKAPVPAPSSDAIDLDVCSDVLVKGCYMEVNDDGVVLKGGKGPWADQSPDNGINERILVEDCKYGFCHSVLTCGSEAIHNNNVLVRRIKLDGAWQLLHLKLRPDTPQHYENIKLEKIDGRLTGSFINANPWTQFFDLKGRTDKPISIVENVIFEDCNVECEVFFNASRDDDKYKLKNFSLKNVKVLAENNYNNFDAVDSVSLQNVIINYK